MSKNSDMSFSAPHLEWRNGSLVMLPATLTVGAAEVVVAVQNGCESSLQLRSSIQEMGVREFLDDDSGSRLFSISFSRPQTLSPKSNEMQVIAERKTASGEVEAALYLAFEVGDKLVIPENEQESAAYITLREKSFEVCLGSPPVEMYLLEMLNVSSEESVDVVLEWRQGDWILVEAKNREIELVVIDNDDLCDILCRKDIHLRALYFQNFFYLEGGLPQEDTDVAHRICAWSRDLRVIVVAAVPNSEGQYLDREGFKHRIVLDHEFEFIERSEPQHIYWIE